MREFIIETFEDLADEMFEIASEGKFVSAVLDFEDASTLTRELLMYECVSIENIRLDIDEDEFYVSLTPDHELYVEFVKNGDQYMSMETDYIYLDGNINSKIIKHIKADVFFEIVKEDIECYDDCEDCEYCYLLEGCDDDDEFDDIYSYDDDSAIEIKLDIENVKSMEEAEHIAHLLEMAFDMLSEKT